MARHRVAAVREPGGLPGVRRDDVGVREARARRDPLRRPGTLVWYEPHALFNNGADTNLANFGDANAGMSFHDYCLAASEGGAGYSLDCQASDGLVFANAEKRSATTGDALLLTEFGATDDRGSLLGVLGLADQNMMSWQEWHYCGCDDPTTTGSGDKQAIVLDPAKPPAGENLKTSTLDALTRPYPQAVAGTPGLVVRPRQQAVHGSWTTRRPGAGAGAFGAGAVSGDRAARAPVPGRLRAGRARRRDRLGAGAAVLRVAACAGADKVAVTVVRRSRVRVQSSCAGPSRGRCAAPPRLAGARAGSGPAGG